MNIVITINWFDNGGAARMVYELVKNIDPSCFTVKIVCIDGKFGSYLEKQILDENFDIIFLKNPRLPQLTGKNIFCKIINKLLFVFFDIVSIIYLYRELSKLKPDIIHAHQNGIWAGYWSIWRNIPLVTTVHTAPYSAFLRFTEKLILRLSILFHRNTFVAISEYNIKLVKSYWKLNDQYIRYVNNGVNISNFCSIPHQIITFINVSRQDKNKNQSLILRAFSRLYHEDQSIPTKLYLVGGGDYHDLLVKEAEYLGIINLVAFTGYVPSSAQYLSDSDIYISSSNREGLSLSVLEGMAAGLPVIATDAGGVRDLAGENGILIPCNDEDALYTAMKGLRDNKELRLAKGKKSLEMVQNYSSVNMAKNYCALYQELTRKEVNKQ
jgi:glycosyltransferase involved in cell wall biosynthesis